MQTKVFVFILMASILVSCSKATSKIQFKYRQNPGNGIAAKAGDIEITEKELNDTIEDEVYRKQLEIFDIRFNRLNSLLVEKILRKDPAAKGMTNDQYMNKYITNNISVSEKELKDFIKSQGVPESQAKNRKVKEKIVQYITIQKKKAALEAWIASKTKKTGVEVYFQRPTPPTYEIDSTGAPYAGGGKAKVTIVEFSDFQCPYCAKAAVVMNKLKKKYGKKIKIVFKQFPLSFHNHAKGAAIASLCANQQGMKYFWKMHDKFFLEKVDLNPEKIKELAPKIGLDAAKFNKCFDEKGSIAQVEKDIQQGKKVGVKGTPSIFINGMLFVDFANFDKYVEFIDEQLAKK